MRGVRGHGRRGRPRGADEGEATRAVRGVRRARASRRAARACASRGERYHEVVGALRRERARARASAGASRATTRDDRRGAARRARAPARVRRARSASATSRSIAARATLSGGEMQRLRLAAQLGSGLTGALYVLDEPTIGLHPRDTRRAARATCARSSTPARTVLVVEHDAETIRAADHLIDLGPGGGRDGGHVVAEGPPAQVLARPDVADRARARASRARVDAAARARWPTRGSSSPARARNNLQGRRRFRVPRRAHVRRRRRERLGQEHARAPGLLPGAAARARARRRRAGRARRAQRARRPCSARSPSISRRSGARRARCRRRSSASGTRCGSSSPRSPEAQDARLRAGALLVQHARSGGRCPACDGQGVDRRTRCRSCPTSIAPCEACGGARFEPATLDVRYLGLSIGDVLAPHRRGGGAASSRATRRSRGRSRRCADLGVGYVQLGQGSNTLSGGEAQRLKLAAELTAGARARAHASTCSTSRRPGSTSPTCAGSSRVLERLVERGDTLVVIEHHPDVIACADWVVELGPEGGRRRRAHRVRGRAGRVAEREDGDGEIFRGGVTAQSISVELAARHPLAEALADHDGT